MAKKPKISVDIYARLVAKGNTKADSYRKAGYVPQGDNDNAKILAKQFEKRKVVKELIERYREEQYGDLKDVTKARLEQLLNEDWEDMDIDQRIKFLGQACRITGVEAPKNFNINQNITERREISADEAIAGLLDDKRFAHIFATAIEGDVIEGQADVGEGDSAIPSDTVEQPESV